MWGCVVCERPRPRKAARRGMWTGPWGPLLWSLQSLGLLVLSRHACLQGACTSLDSVLGCEQVSFGHVPQTAGGAVGLAVPSSVRSDPVGSGFPRSHASGSHPCQHLGQPWPTWPSFLA